MRNTRSPAEWRSLFDEQFRSGLNKTQFCRLHGITRSAFSNAMLRLSATKTSSFVSAFPPDLNTRKNTPSDSQPEYTPAPGAVVQPSPLTEHQFALILPGATLSLPADISPRWLATLLREIAP